MRLLWLASAGPAHTCTGVTNQESLSWGCASTNTSRSEEFSEPFRVVNGFTYRLGLEVMAGQVRAAVRSPVLLWYGARGDGHGWTCVPVASCGAMFFVTIVARTIRNPSAPWPKVSIDIIQRPAPQPDVGSRAGLGTIASSSLHPVTSSFDCVWQIATTSRPGDMLV